MTSDENQPLIGHHLLSNNVFSRIVWDRSPHENTYINPARHRVQQFLTSKAGHYAVLILVSLDVGCIFADILISLFVCEKVCKSGANEGTGLETAQEALSIVSLVFSCLFMAELLASVWSFGPRCSHSQQQSELGSSC